MDYSVTIDKFEGPLDLLLHLIKKNDIDIFDIDIAQITEQYLNYINAMSDLNLDVSSEYLVMASDLTLMKSKGLLPALEEEVEEAKEELIDRLTQYQKYKEATSLFKELEVIRKQSFAKDPSFFEEYKTDEVKLNNDITLDDLLKALERFRQKKELEKPLNTVVARKEYSVYKRNIEIMNKLRKIRKMNFEDLFEEFNKDYVVVTFLSILDLAKKGELTIKQEHNLDEIILIASEVE